MSALAPTAAQFRPTPTELLGDFSRGIVQDAPRTAIPPNGVYDAADFLLHEVGVAMKRGGTSYAGPAMALASYAAGVVYAEFPAGGQVVALGDSGYPHLFVVTPGSTTDKGSLGASGFPPIDTPKLRIGGGKNLLIIPAANGTTAPQKYDGSAAPSALGGSPPAGKVCAIYKTRVYLAGASAAPQRVYASPTPDIEATWDTANSYLDADYPVTGLAPLANQLLVFSQGHLERFIGTTPPPGTDMDHQPIGAVGCTDARSIVVTEGNVVFANQRGVYMTNGSTPISLTEEGLYGSKWRSLLSGYDPATWVISAGLMSAGFLVVSILDNTGALKATLMCNVAKRAWWRLTNVRAVMFSTAVGAQEELYYADRATNRVTKLAGIFTPTAGNKNDANGTAVAPFLETRLVGAGEGLKHFGFARLSYDLRDAAADNPTLAVTVAPGLEATTYAAVAESPLAETADETRARFTVAKVSQGVSFRFQQSGPSAKTELYALAVEARQMPPMQGGQ